MDKILLKVNFILKIISKFRKKLFSIIDYMNQCINRHITHSMDFESVQCMSVIINLMCLRWWVICNK